jgi:hypothetical protein
MRVGRRPPHEGRDSAPPRVEGRSPLRFAIGRGRAKPRRRAVPARRERAWVRLGGTRNAATQPRPHDTHSRVPKETLRKLAPRGRSRGWGTREPAKNPRTQSSDGNDDGKDYLDCPPDLMARRGDCANPGRSGGGRGSGLGRRRPQIAACSQRPSPIGLGRPHPHSLPLRCSVPV